MKYLILSFLVALVAGAIFLTTHSPFHVSASNLASAYPRVASIYSKADENSDAGKKNIAKYNLYVSDMTWWGLLCGGDFNCLGHGSMTTGQYFKFLNPNQVDLMYQHSIFSEGWSAPADGRGYIIGTKPYYFDLRWILTYAGSTLSSDITSSATSIPVNDISKFHIGDNAIVGGVANQSNPEMVKVTAIKTGVGAAGILTVNRAQFSENGTFPAIVHSSGDFVRPTAYGFNSQDLITFNMTSQCQVSNINPDFGPETYNQFQASFWAAKIANDPLYSNLDGVFLDNFVSLPGQILNNPTQIDYENQNVATDPTTGDNYFKAGMTDNAAQMRSALPNKIVLANVGASAADNGQYLNGGMVEGVDQSGKNCFVGDQNCDPTTFYNSWESNGFGPPAFIYNGSDSTGGNVSAAQTNYQVMRYLLTKTLLNNGYFTYDEFLANGGHQTEWWYDEYDNAGQGAGYLGNSLGGATQVSAGVWRRDFDNGIALNNDNSTSQTVDLGGNFQKIHGTQDPVTNDGSIVSSVTLKPKDGIILLRTSLSPTPTPTATATPAPTPTPTPTALPTPTPTPDTTAPAVSITSPQNGASVFKNSTININANASDNVGVTRVEFYVDSSLTCTDTATPYSCSWHVPAPKGRTYTLSAKAFDGAGNFANSFTVSVTAK
jgi:hypothetical protein